MRQTLFLNVAVLFLSLTACAPQNLGPKTLDTQNLPVRRAFFETNPTRVHGAFRAACESPGDVFSQPNRETAICRFLPGPDMAAYLLSTFDGKLEIPKLVIKKTTRRRQSGFEVEISYFAEVLKKSGHIQRVYAPDRTVDRRIDQLLKEAGGQPAD